MTMRTYTHLVCPCGHRGTIKLTENDQPYSANYERTDYIDGDHRAESWGVETTFQKQGIKCPNCGA